MKTDVVFIFHYFVVVKIQASEQSPQKCGICHDCMSPGDPST